MTQVVYYHHKRPTVKSSQFLVSYNSDTSVSQSMPILFVVDRVIASQIPAKDFYVLIPRTCEYVILRGKEK